MPMSRRTQTVESRRARRALGAEVKRAVALLRSIQHPEAPGLGVWSVADVAMHLSQAWTVLPGLARADLTELRAAVPSFHDTPGPALMQDIWSLGELTRDGVRSDPERDLGVLAGRIQARAAEYLAMGDDPVGGTRTWLVEGVEVALVTLTCHLLNETIVHSWDMARGDGRAWDISGPHAALVFDGFVVPALQALGPRVMVNQEAASGLQATYELRVRGGGRHVFVFDDGALTIEAPSARSVDCILDADPAALLLVVWKRVEAARPIVDRKLVASGPKAWLAPRLPGLMRIT